MNTWKNWVHPREEAKQYFFFPERMNELFDLAEKIAKHWYSTEVRHYFNHHTKSHIDLEARIKLREYPLSENEKKVIYSIVYNYLPNRDKKITVGWLLQKFNKPLFYFDSEIDYERKMIVSLHNTDNIIEGSSIFNIKKTEKLEGDRELRWMWSWVEKDNSEVEQAHETMLNRLNELLKEDADNKELYEEYIQRLNNAKEEMAEEVKERKLKYIKRLNNQAFQEPLNPSGHYGFYFDSMQDNERNAIRRFFIHMQHSDKPMVYVTNNATYTIHFLSEKIVGKSAYKFEPVKERQYRLDIKTKDKAIEGIKVLLVPELVTGGYDSSKMKPGEVFSSKVYHPKYKKVVGVKKGLYSGKYYLFLDYPKYEDGNGLSLYKNPELFTI